MNPYDPPGVDVARPDDQPHTRQMVKGAVAAVVVNAVAVIPLGLLLFPALFIGLIQVAWVLPWVLHARKTRPGFAQGLIVGAVVTFLLNAGCWGTWLVLASQGMLH
ncbi:MAG: hypothetical protein H6739_11730 [Alphaproteobacteria bacterium]|nr:hypothetical protein [Alphaproteobacteria bacterium]